MHLKSLFVVTAVAETGTGVCLLVLPEAAFLALLGNSQAAAEATFVGRIAGAALLAIGVASWIGRSSAPSPARDGLVAGLLVYNVSASALLAYAGLGLMMVGALLWPAVVLHLAMAAWSTVFLRTSARGVA